MAVLLIDCRRKEYWELSNEAGKKMVEDFGFDMYIDASHIEEDEVATIIKLKK